MIMIKKSLSELAGKFIQNGTKFNFNESMENLRQLEKIEINEWEGYNVYYLSVNLFDGNIDHCCAIVAEDRGLYVPTYQELEEWQEARRRKRQEMYSAMRMYKQLQESKKKPAHVRDEAKHQLAAKRRRTAARLAKGREIMAACCGH